MVYADPLAPFLPSLEHWGPVVAFAQWTGLEAFPAHASDVLFFAGFYTVLCTLAPYIARNFIYKEYDSLNAKARHGFDTHIVSSVNAVMMCALSYPFFGDKNLTQLDSYTPYAGFVVAHCVGYFIWDLCITLKYYRFNGAGFLFHAIAALYVFCEGLRPFMINVSAPFIWFEASTPFVNINWFGSYVPGLISPNVRLINGLILLVVFFLCRIVSGPYFGYYFILQIFYECPPQIPSTTVFGVLLCYLVLVGLNFVWFQKMLKIAAKTFSKRK